VILANLSGQRVSRDILTEESPAATREGNWFWSTRPIKRKEEEEGEREGIRGERRDEKMRWGEGSEREWEREGFMKWAKR
jgi:hypothetical protein